MSAYQTVNLPFPTVGKQTTALPQAVPRIGSDALACLQDGTCMLNVNGCPVKPAFFIIGSYPYAGGQEAYVASSRVTRLPAIPYSS